MPNEVTEFLTRLSWPALHPRLGDTWNVRFDEDWLRDLKTFGPGMIREIYSAVPQVLLRPTAIFRGLQRPIAVPHGPVTRAEDCFCYAGLPDVAFDHPSGVRVDPYQGEVHLVYIDQDGYYFFSDWETADPLDPTIPCNSNTRFLEKLRP